MSAILTYYRRRGLLLLAAALCFGLFALVGDGFGIPPDPGRGGSLLWSAGALVDWVGVILALGASVAVGTVVAGRWKFDLGLAAAAAGMVALAHRGGPVQYVLLYASGNGIYLALAIELALLFALLGLTWAALLYARRVPIIQSYLAERTAEERLADARDPDSRDPEEPLDQKLLGLAVASAVMAVAMLIFCRTDSPTQCLAAVGISAFLAVLCGHQFVPSRPSVWWWTVPLIVGGLGYLTAFFGPADLLKIGETGGYLAPLARPLPLVYASAGVCGAILGYHVSRRMRADREEEGEEEMAKVQ